MRKTITINGRDIQLDNNIGWTLEYRDQFNRDIVPTMMPMIAGLMDAFVGLISSTGKVGELSIDDMVAMAKSQEMFDALVKVSAFEFVDLLNITWAMAKTADENISDPRRWIREVGAFPIDTVGPVVFEMILQGVVSSKNWERLQKALKDLKPTEEKEKKSE